MTLPRVHDLLELRADARVTAVLAEEQELLDGCLTAARFVVVRRAQSDAELVAVGVRGVGRHERYAGLVRLEDVVACHGPESLRVHCGQALLPAFEALKELQKKWEGLGLAWGPVGSVGFALASGRECVGAASDLDIAIRVEPEEVSGGRLREMFFSLEGLPCRVDVLVETAAGGFALQEAASGEANVLRRAKDGVELVQNPWERSASGVARESRQVSA